MYCTVKTCKYFLKLNDNNICIDSFKDHNHFNTSEPIINWQKLDNNLKRISLNVINVE